MKKQTLLFLVFLLCIACKSIKVDELELDYVQPLKGNVKSIVAKETSFKINKGDTIKKDGKIEVFYNRKNSKIKQIDYYNNETHTTHYLYNQYNLLTNSISKTKDSVIDLRHENLYDKDKNLIEYRSFHDNKLYLIKQNSYDKRGNKILQKMIFPDNNNNNNITKFFYNYKSKYYTSQSLDSNNVPKYDIKGRTYFDKNGRLIKTERFTEKEFKNLKDYSIKIFDKKGNLIRRTYYDKNGKIINESSYINMYDEKGNITKRTSFYNNKIFESTIFEIEYY